MNKKLILIPFMLIVLVFSVTATIQFPYDGATVCTKQNEWCGQGNNGIYEYTPSQGTSSGINTTLTSQNITTINADGEPLSYDFNNDGTIDLVYVHNNKLYSYYWDATRWRQQSVQTLNYSLSPYDLNVFQVDSGFTPSNNCVMDSNTYIFAQNGTNIFLFGINDTDFCLANETELGTYETKKIVANNTMFKCAYDGGENQYLCVGTAQLYNSTGHLDNDESEIIMFTYNYISNNLELNGAVVSDKFGITNFRHYPELGDADGDGSLDYLFMNENKNLTLFTKMNTAIPTIRYFNTAHYLTAGNRFPCTDSANTPLIDYKIVEIESSNLYSEIAVAFFGYGDSGTWKQRITVYYLDGTELTNFPQYYGERTGAGSHTGWACDEGVPSRIFQHNCLFGGSGDNDLLIGFAGLGVKGSLGGLSKTGVYCVNAYGESYESSVDETTTPYGASGKRNTLKSINLGDYDGDGDEDVLVGNKVYELHPDIGSASLIGIIAELSDLDKIGLIHYDFSGDGYLDYLFTGSTTKVISITTSNNASSNTVPFYYQTYFDTCSPVCVNNNITFMPSFNDNEDNAVKFEIDCNADGIYETATNWINDYSSVLLACNFSTVGIFEINMRLSDIYNPDQYQIDTLDIQVFAEGNCYSTGQYDTECILSTTSSNFSVDINSLGINVSNFAGTDIDGYNAKNYDWGGKCGEWPTISRPLCPILNIFLGGLTAVFTSFWTYFGLALMLILCVVIYAVVKK